MTIKRVRKYEVPRLGPLGSTRRKTSYLANKVKEGQDVGQTQYSGKCPDCGEPSGTVKVAHNINNYFQCQECDEYIVIPG